MEDLNLVKIGTAAKLLGVSIDTIRRWDKKGRLTPVRDDKNRRLFVVSELQKLKEEKPLTISEAAQKLGVSATTLRRAEKQGLIRPERNTKGERRYSFEHLETYKAVDNNSILNQNLENTVPLTVQLKPEQLQRSRASRWSTPTISFDRLFDGLHDSDLGTKTAIATAGVFMTLMFVASFAGILLINQEKQVQNRALNIEKQQTKENNSKLGSNLKNVNAQELSTNIFASAAKNMLAKLFGVQNQATNYTAQLTEGSFGVLGEVNNKDSKQILAALTSENDGIIFNIPTLNNKNSIFGEDVEIQGTLTAPNVIYSLTAGTGITLTGDQDVTISSSGGVTSLQSQSGALTFTEGTGIDIDGLTINSTITDTDTDDQSLFETISVSGESDVVADSATDTLTFVAGTGLSITTSASGDSITFTGTADPGWTDDGTTVRLSTITDTIGIGTVSPGAKLDTLATTEQLRLSYDSSNYTSFTVSSGGNLTLAPTGGTTAVTGALTTSGAVTLGDATSDNITFTGRLANGTSIIPNTDLGSDLGSSSLRFNNLWVANINSNSSQSFSGQTTFSYAPTSTAITQASVIINPTTSVDNGQLLAFGIAGFQRALVDEDGDLVLGYNNLASAPTTDYPLDVYGHSGTRIAYLDTSGNLTINGSFTSAGTSFSSNITMADDTWIGLGAGAGRMEFDDQATDELNILTARLGLGTSTPASLLDVGGGTAGSVDGTSDILVADDVEIDDDLFVDDDVTIAGGAINLTAATNIDLAASTTALTFETDLLGLDTTNDSIDIVSASATADVLDITVDSLTTAKLFDISADALSSGNIFYGESTSTALSTGDLMSLYWNPGSATTASSGSTILTLNVGSNGVIDKIFDVQNAGSSVFSVGQSSIISALPHSFTAAGDINVAYDLVFTNQTSGNIKSLGPLSIESGESFESNYLTLKTYNSGEIYMDASGGVEIDTGTSSDTALTIDQDDTDATALDVDVVNVSGDIINLDWNTATTQTAALTGLDLDFTNLTTSGSHAFYGLHLNDQAGATASTEYGIYVQGTNWDQGIYTEDDITLAAAANLAVLGGEVAITEDSAGNVPLAITGAASQTGSLIDLNGTSVSGDVVNIDWTGATNQTGALTGLDLDFTNLTADGTNAVYGIHVNDQVGATASTEYGIYVEGTNWDQGIYVVDASRFDGSMDLNADLDLDSNSATAFTVGDGSSTFLTVDATTDAADTVLTLDGTGVSTGNLMALTADAITQGDGIDLSADALTTGRGIYVESTSTALSTGDLASLYWNPGSATTASSGSSILTLNVGSNGIIDKILDVQNAGSSVFSVGQSSIVSALPHSFTAAGDVNIAYDLQFTNQTASYLKSNAPLYFEAGETFESNDLTLRTFNSGEVVLDAGGGAVIDTGTSGGVALTIDQDDTDDTALDIDVANVGGDIINLDWNTATTQTAALTGLDLDFTNLTTSGSHALYGLHLNDQAGATASTEYGIYVQGTNWDQGIYTEDDITLAAAANLAVLGGEVAITEDSAGNVPLAITGAASQTGSLIDLNGTSVSGDMVNLDWTSGTTQTGALTGIDVDLTNLTASGSHALYGIHVNDQVAATASTEYGIFVEGTNYDWGIYTADNIHSAGGVNIGDATSTNNLFDDASTGAGSTTMYIGNASIDVTASDMRLKENIVDSQINALDLLAGLNIKDFDWKVGTKWSGRGRATGLIAQEVYEYLPQVVDKPSDPNNTWSVEYHHLVPYAIKGIQELANADSEFRIQNSEFQVQLDNLGAVQNSQNQLLPVGQEDLTTLQTDINGHEDRIAQLSQENQSILERLAELESVIAGNPSVILGSEATPGSEDSGLGQNDGGEVDGNIASGEATIASAEAVLSELNNLNNINCDEERCLIPHDLLVSGSSNFNDVSVTGTANFGLLSITGLNTPGVAGTDSPGVDGTGAAINAIGTLYLQNDYGSEAVDFFDQEVIITKEGNLDVKGVVTAEKFAVLADQSSATLGEAVLKSGTKKIIVETTAINSNSRIFITPKTVTSLPLIVSTKNTGVGFTVEIASNAPSDIKFDWFIVEEITN